MRQSASPKPRLLLSQVLTILTNVDVNFEIGLFSALLMYAAILSGEQGRLRRRAGK